MFTDEPSGERAALILSATGLGISVYVGGLGTVRRRPLTREAAPEMYLVSEKGFLGMPSAPLHYCGPTCNVLVAKGKCKAHSQNGWRQDASRIRGRRLQRLRETLFCLEPFCRACKVRSQTFGITSSHSQREAPTIRAISNRSVVSVQTPRHSRKRSEASGDGPGGSSDTPADRQGNHFGVTRRFN